MIISNYASFLDKLFEKLKQLKLNITGLEIDHLGYSTTSSSEYEKVKVEIAKLGTIIRENIIGGRRVGACKLDHKLTYHGLIIPALEFIEPMKDEKTISGLEHAEFIVKVPLEKFMSKYPTLPWDSSHIKRDQFPRLKLILGKGLEVKFHLTSILEE